MKQFYVYILCSKRNGTLYTGVTSDLVQRVYEHKNVLVEGFTEKYNVHRLVWFESMNRGNLRSEEKNRTCPCEGRDKKMEKGMEVETHRDE